MLTIQARQLLQYSTQELSEALTGEFKIAFEDGVELQTNAAQTLYSSHIWDLLRKYPKTVFTSKMHLSTHLKKSKFNSKTTNKCYSEHFKEIIAAYYLKEPGFSRETLMREIYEVNNNIYNYYSIHSLPWVSSLDIIDFKEVLDNKDIIEIKANIVETPQGVIDAQKKVLATLMESPVLDNNRIAQGVRADILSAGQVAKCIGPCGYVTDMDSHIFPKPILRGFAEGLRSFYDSMIESRSGAKSLLFAKRPLQTTVYFSRRLEIVSMTLRNLHHGTDCGSTEYLEWFIKPEERNEEGKVVYSGDLAQLAGKYYLDEATNTLKILTKDDTHLIGTRVKLRSVLHCRHSDPYGVCSTCFGALSISVPEGTNLGHICTVTMAMPVNQSVLSVKHLDNSAVVDSVNIRIEDLAFIRPASDGQGYRIAKDLMKLEPVLVIKKKDGSYFSHIADVADVRELPVNRITELAEVFIECYTRVPTSPDEKDVTPRVRHPLDLSIQRRKASFTHDFLAHVKKVGWTHDHKGNFLIDLKGWDTSLDFATLPLKHHNMADYAADVANIIESNMKEIKRRRISTTTEIITRLFDLVNSRNKVNLAVLEVILLSVLTVDDTKYNYAIPKVQTGYMPTTADTVLYHRNVAAAMSYEQHVKVLNAPENFLVEDKPDHPFDWLLVPEEMIAAGRSADY